MQEDQNNLHMFKSATRAIIIGSRRISDFSESLKRLCQHASRYALSTHQNYNLDLVGCGFPKSDVFRVFDYTSVCLILPGVESGRVIAANNHIIMVSRVQNRIGSCLLAKRELDLVSNIVGCNNKKIRPETPVVFMH